MMSKISKKPTKILLQTTNKFLKFVSLKLVSIYSDYRNYIPCKKAIQEAEKAGLSVGDYLERKHNKPGESELATKQMIELGVFQDKIERVCEIGPGSGRYLEKTIKACQPIYYEIYETEDNWKKFLVETYQVVAHYANGFSLASTPSNSIDLVKAHKVFVGLSFLNNCRYFSEMVRVVKNGGKIVFDIVTEDCMNKFTLEDWLKAKAGDQLYPSMMPKQYTIDFFSEHDCSLDGSFMIPMKPGKTECFVFTKLPC
jgi:SAM-dependent methyltransferase